MLGETDLLAYAQKLVENFLFNIPDMHTVGSVFSCIVNVILATCESPTHSWNALLPTSCLWLLIITQSLYLCASLPCHSSNPALQLVSSSYCNSGESDCTVVRMCFTHYNNAKLNYLHTFCHSMPCNSTICTICSFYFYLHLLFIHCAATASQNWDTFGYRNRAQ